MSERLSFRALGRRIALGFLASLALIFVLGVFSFYAIRRSVTSDSVAFDQATELADFGQFQSAIERKMTAFRGYLLSGAESYLADVGTSRTALLRRLEDLRRRTSGKERELLDRIERAEGVHEEAVQKAIALRRSGGSLESVALFFVRDVEPHRRALEAAIDSYLVFKRETMRAAHIRSQQQNAFATALILVVAFTALVLVFALSVALTRRLASSLEIERHERKRAEASARALADSEERKAAVFASALDAIVTIDHEGRIVEFNPAAERMFGYAASEAAGREMAELLIPERLRQGHREGMARYRDTGVSRILGQRIEMPALRRDGSEFPVELAIRAIRPGRETLFTAFVRDITERKRAEEERTELLERERAARARAEAEESRSAFLAEASEVLGSSLDYRTTLFSVAALAVREIADWCFVDVMEEENFSRIAVVHSSPDRAALARELEERQLFDPNARKGPPNVMRTGEAEWNIDVSDDFLEAIARTPEDHAVLRSMGIRSTMCVPIRVRERIAGILTFFWAESGRLYTFEDMRLAEELARRAGVAVDNAGLYRDAREAVRLRDDFLSIASHELKTPITTLQLQLQSLLKRTQPGAPAIAPEKLVSRLVTADRQVDRLSRLIHNLLDLSRITAGRFDLEREPVDLEIVVREALSRFSEELQRAGCVVELRIEGNSHVGEWDRTRADQIVTNLLSNAAKYGAGGRVEVSLTGDAETSRLTVRDHGIGIPPEDQSRIFGRFERAVSVRHYGGLGLGLWIVRQIVEALGGRISVESQPREGSAFTVELPRRAPPVPAEQLGS